MHDANEPRRGWRRWRVALALFAVGLSLVLPATWIEHGYSRGVFPLLQAMIVPVTGAVAWPLMGTVLLLLPVILLGVAIKRSRRARAAGASWSRLLAGGAWWGVRRALYVYALFLLLWGYGYQRVPIEARWQLGDEPLTIEDVRDVQMRLVAVLHRDAAAADGDPEQAWQVLAGTARDLVAEREGFTPSLPAHIKHPPPGWLIAAGIYGAVSPFTLEANVDPALPLPYRLGIDAHELAHLLGYCGEADANLVAFVAGMRAADPLARYGAALSMIRYAMSARHAQDATRIYQLLPERARADLRLLRKRRERHEVRALSEIQSAVNDTYLKTQGVALGTDDYNRGFTLFVRAVRQGLVELPAPYRPPQGK